MIDHDTTVDPYTSLVKCTCGWQGEYTNLPALAADPDPIRAVHGHLALQRWIMKATASLLSDKMGRMLYTEHVDDAYWPSGLKGKRGGRDD